MTKAEGGHLTDGATQVPWDGAYTILCKVQLKPKPLETAAVRNQNHKYKAHLNRPIPLKMVNLQLKFFPQRNIWILPIISGRIILILQKFFHWTNREHFPTYLMKPAKYWYKTSQGQYEKGYESIFLINTGAKILKKKKKISKCHHAIFHNVSWPRGIRQRKARVVKHSDRGLCLRQSSSHCQSTGATKTPYSRWKDKKHCGLSRQWNI